MTCEPCTSLPASEEDSLQTSSSDIPQLSLWSGNHTPAKSSEKEPPKDGSPICQCGKGMSDCSIHPSTLEMWIASMRDSLAKILALLESRQAYLREPDQVFTEKSCVFLTSLDLATSSWKTSQQSFLTDSEPYSQTWPRWGMTQGGSAYAHPMSERRITETGGLHFVPTPDTMNHRDGTNLRKDCNIKEGGMHGVSLHHYVAMWPTPTATDYKGSPTGGALDKRRTMSRGVRLPEQVMRIFATPLAPRAHDSENTAGKYYPSQNQEDLTSQVARNGGQLNPDWVGWLMGFPIGWANSKATVMPKSRCKPQLHGNSLEENDAKVGDDNTPTQQEML